MLWRQFFLYESAFGNKVSFINLHDAGLTVHVMWTSGEVYIAKAPVQGEHQDLP